MSQWSKEECERRFVQGEKITLPALSRVSTVKLSTLKTWSTKGQWIAKRETFQAELAVATHDKTIEALSTSLADLEITHATAYATLRECAMAKVNALKVRIEMVADRAKILPGIAIDSLGADAVNADRQAQAQAQGEAIRDSDVLDLQALTNVVDKCIRGERMVLGAEYEDLNKAVAAIVRAGLQVRNRKNEIVTGE